MTFFLPIMIYNVYHNSTKRYIVTQVTIAAYLFVVVFFMYITITL